MIGNMFIGNDSITKRIYDEDEATDRHYERKSGAEAVDDSLIMSSTDGMQAGRVSLGSSDRKLRYRALLEELSSLDEEIGNNADCMEKTANVVREAKELLANGSVEERVQHPGEGYLDSRVLRGTSDLAIRCSEAVSGNVNMYNWHDLAQNIRENGDFWDFTFPREVPSVSYLHGTFAATPPEQRARPARRRAERLQAAPVSAPEAVDRLEKVEEGSEMVSRVNRFINKTYKSNGQKALSYFHLVLDPDSFARTVENIYYISFLVRDGMVAVDLDDEYELPFLVPSSPSESDSGDISDENQFIVSIDMKRWKELVDAFRIVKPMMVLKR